MAMTPTRRIVRLRPQGGCPMRLLICALSILTTTAVCVADEGIAPVSHGNPRAPVPERVPIAAPATEQSSPCLADPVQQVANLEPSLHWWPGDSGLDYLQRCAIGCQG
jgi:hypothetical protein